MMKAEIISTGSELMSGLILDTNSAAISNLLTKIGLKVIKHTSLGDDLVNLVKALKDAWENNNIVIVTGGLGPTKDDLTREAATEAFNSKLVYQEFLAQELKAYMELRGYQISSNNLKQAYLPQGFKTLTNKYGTAPGFMKLNSKKAIFFLPGVPSEALPLIQETVLPLLIENFHLKAHQESHYLYYRVAGLGESVVDELLAPLKLETNTIPALGLLANGGEVTVCLSIDEKNERNEILLQKTSKEVEDILKGHIFARQLTSLPKVLSEKLKLSKLSLAILDGCTKGYLVGYLTQDISDELFLFALIKDTIQNYNYLKNHSADIKLFLGFDGASKDKIKLLIQSQYGVYEAYYTIVKEDSADRVKRSLSFWATFHLWSYLTDLSKNN